MNSPENHFDKAQRQSPLGIITNGVLFVKEVVKAVVFPLIIFIIKVKLEELIYVLYGLIAILLIALIFGYLYYKNFLFKLDQQKGKFIIDKGIFSKKHLTIPLDKIQQVEINQSLIQRLIGVYSVEIDSAGTDKKEVKISSVKKSTAIALKNILLNKKSDAQLSANECVNGTGEDEQSILKIDLETLIRVGMTSNYGQSIALLISFTIATYHNFKELLQVFNKNDELFNKIIFNSSFSLLATTVVLSVLFVIMISINLIKTLIRYYNFKISKANEALLFSSGLLTQRNTLITPNKVQVIAINENYLQRKMNISTLKIEQAHDGHTASNKEVKQNHLEVPGCNPPEKEEVLKLILGQVPTKGQEFKPNFRFLNLPIFFNPNYAVEIFIDKSIG